jgi:hypothetical protein
MVVVADEFDVSIIVDLEMRRVVSSVDEQKEEGGVDFISPTSAEFTA